MFGTHDLYAALYYDDSILSSDSSPAIMIRRGIQVYRHIGHNLKLLWSAFSHCLHLSGLWGLNRVISLVCAFWAYRSAFR